MTTYFEYSPDFCPMCGHELKFNNAIDGFHSGNVCNCPSCQFEYAQVPDALLQCTVGHKENYAYTDSKDGTIRCAICDLQESWSRISALEAIVDEDKVRFADMGGELFKQQAEIIAAQVVAMAREEIRKATIEAFNMPLEELGRFEYSKELPEIKSPEGWTAKITERGTIVIDVDTRPTSDGSEFAKVMS